MPRKYSEKEFLEKFWKRVDVRGPDECWPWLIVKMPDEYGRVLHNGKLEGSHRVSFSIANGDIPPGAQILHKCDNPPCCNPRHLFIGTNLDNVRDKIVKGRGNQAKGEIHYRAKLTEKNVSSIRSMADRGIAPKEVSNIFGISQDHARNIIKRKIWRHI
jgi:hypothetical protein